MKDEWEGVSWNQGKQWGLDSMFEGVRWDSTRRGQSRGRHLGRAKTPQARLLARRLIGVRSSSYSEGNGMRKDSTEISCALRMASCWRTRCNRIWMKGFNMDNRERILIWHCIVVIKFPFLLPNATRTLLDHQLQDRSNQFVPIVRTVHGKFLTSTIFNRT